MPVQDRSFVDTNIFVYAYDEREPQKKSIAQELLLRLSDESGGMISSQVIQEFCNVMVKQQNIRRQELEIVLETVFEPMLHHLPSTDFYSRAENRGLQSADVRLPGGEAKSCLSGSSLS